MKQMVHASIAIGAWGTSNKPLVAGGRCPRYDDFAALLDAGLASKVDADEL